MDPIVITAQPVHGAHARENLKFEYDFPRIKNINDVLPAIQDRPEFVVAEKEGYTVINYNVNFEDTFPPVKVAGGCAKQRAERSLHNALRRECRGIIFDSKTGDIIRRPYHKFFNVNERDETLERNVNLSNGHKIMEKLDGSMICPFIVNGEMIWGTKMGATDVAKPVEEFVKNNPKYVRFADWMLKMNFTPIFEWCSNKQRIVIDQPEDRLVLTALRHINDGHYVDYGSLSGFASDCKIPYVKVLTDGNDNMSEFVKYVHDLEDLEGFVVRFDSGHMVKLKCHWYIQIHKAKEAILQDRNIVQLILENKLDDIKANVTPEEREKLSVFESDINKNIKRITKMIWTDVQFFKSSRFSGDRRDFAIDYAPEFNGFVRPIMFSMWDKEGTKTQIEDAVCKTIRNNLGRTVKYEEIRDVWFPGVKYND